MLKSVSQAISAVSGLMKNITGNVAPFQVVDISDSQIKGYAVIGQEGPLTLYKDKDVYCTVLHCYEPAQKYYSLFRLQSNEEATLMFTCLIQSLVPLYSAASIQLQDKGILQSYMDLVQTHRSWSCAHFAAKLMLSRAFRHHAISCHLNDLDEFTQVSPIQVAIETENLYCVQELLVCGVVLNMADSNGNNVFHYAAKCKDSSVIQYLASKDKSAINQLNVLGETALHMACSANCPHNVEMLIRWGADPNLSMTGPAPIHCAVKNSALECAMVLVKWSHDQLNLLDKKYAGTPLHWARDRKALTSHPSHLSDRSVYALAEKGVSLDTCNKLGQSALHVMVQKKRFPAVMGLLVQGANAELVNHNGDNALHLAIQSDSAELVQALIVFGANVNYMNAVGHTPRHLAARHDGKNRPYLLYLLHRVGARRCPRGVEGCKDGCEPNGTFNGTPLKQEVLTPTHHKKTLHDETKKTSMSAAMTRTNSATGSALMTGSDQIDSPTRVAGDRVLCLDGGGIRGLILIQTLLAIERATGQPTRNLFDWVAGTSTGGILALGIAFGKTARHALGLYFKLKDDVFVGSRPYSSENLENFLKKEFGEHTRMNETTHPKVLVTGVLGDRHPAELHMFRNYEPLCVDFEEIARHSQFDMPPRPHEQYVWRAARSSGAAPTYFRAFGRFLDGGLISNNPTLDMMTEIHEYHTGLRALNRPSEIRPIHVVVSVGTGRLPLRKVNAVDVFKPEGVMDIYKTVIGAKNLAEMVVEAATQSEGRPVERAQAWCSMIGVPYFRFSPQLSEDVALDCTSDETLVHMLWETQCYLHDHSDDIKRLAILLWP